MRLGYTEYEIDDMTIPFFNGVLKALGRVLNWEKMVSFAGNSFMKDIETAINDANPMVPQRKMTRGWEGMLSTISTNNVNDLGDLSEAFANEE